MSYNQTVHKILSTLTDEYANETEEELVNSTEHTEDGFSIIDCPICGHKTMDMYWICSGCGWEYDIFIDYENDEEFSDCNGTTLGEYKNAYRILRDVFTQRTVGNLDNFYLITCYRKDFLWDAPNEKTYGPFESLEAATTALHTNKGNIRDYIYDIAVIDKFDLNFNAEEIKWFVWSDETKGFFETEQKADWSSGWVRIDSN